MNNQSPLDWIKFIGIMIGVTVLAIVGYKIYVAIKAARDVVSESLTSAKQSVIDTYTAVSHKIDAVKESIDDNIGDTLLTVIDTATKTYDYSAPEYNTYEADYFPN